MSFQKNVTVHTYTGNSVVNFFVDKEDHLTVTIDTKPNELHLRSVESSKEHYDFYTALYDDAEVMSQFDDGKPKSEEYVKKRIDTVWAKRWKGKDPFSAFVVYENETKKPIGHVALGHNAPGVSEIAYVFDKNHWNKGYGTEAAKAVVEDFAPATVAEGYILEGKPLETITATCRLTNQHSEKILKEKLGMQKIGEDEKDGNKRNIYSLKISGFAKKV